MGYDWNWISELTSNSNPVLQRGSVLQPTPVLILMMYLLHGVVKIIPKRGKSYLLINIIDQQS